MQKLKIILLVALLAPTLAHTFINIESLRQSTEIGHLGSVGFRVSGDIGNTETLHGSFSTLDGYKTDKREILIMADYSYGQSSGLKDRNRGRIHLRHTRNYEDFPDIELFAQAQFDEFTRLTMRALTGSNLRFTLYEKDKSFLYLGTGLFYEKQVRKNFPNKKGVRANIYLSYLYNIHKRLEASITAYYQPYVDKFSDHWINSSFSLDYFLTERLSFVNQINLSYESRPPKGIKTNDINFYTGFNIRY